MASADPPAYATSPTRSITDLRNQILANSTILHPLYQNSVELIVAKIHPDVGPIDLSRSDNKVYAELSVAAAMNAGKHYAVLTLRNPHASRHQVRILIKGLPCDTVEAALEWMLERTEKDVHGMVMKYGRAEREGCSVM